VPSPQAPRAPARGIPAAFLLLALLGSTVPSRLSAGPVEHALVIGGCDWKLAAGELPGVYGRSGAFLLGYRAFLGPIGVGVEWNRFTVRRRANLPADYRIDWMEVAWRGRLGVTLRPVRLSLQPSVGLGLESAYQHFLTGPSTTGYCWGCGDGSTRRRSYFVMGLAGEAGWPPAGPVRMAVGAFGRRLFETTELSTDAPYPPALAGSIGGYVALQYRR